MFCPKCGSGIPNDVARCPNCGASIRGLAGEPFAADQSQDAMPHDSRTLRLDTRPNQGPEPRPSEVPRTIRLDTHPSQWSEPQPSQVPVPQPSEDKGKDNGKGKSRRTVAIAASIVAAVAIVATAVYFTTRSGSTTVKHISITTTVTEGSSTEGTTESTTEASTRAGESVKLEYMLDGELSDDASGSERLTADSDGTITLPDQPGERDGYAFIGWAEEPAQQKLDEEPIEPGTKVNMDDAPYVYYAVWRPLATFDGNGADGGETKPVHADLSGNIELPECGFSRKGYVFVGWQAGDPSKAEYEADGKPAGTKEDINFPQSYYACWRKSIVLPEVSLDKAGTFKGDVKGWDSTMCAVAVIVKNDSSSVLEIEGTFGLFTESDSKVEDATATSTYGAIGPGESRPVVARTSRRADKATYSLEAKEPFPGTISPKGIEVTTVESDKDGVKVKLTNKETDSPMISTVCFVAKDKDGYVFVGGEYVGLTLREGESTDVALTSESLYNAGPEADWSNMDITYYVSGTSSDPNYWEELLAKDLEM